MKSDIEIAQEAKIQPILEVAKKLGLGEDDLEQYGKYKAKVNFEAINRMNKNKDGKLILVTAITPTPAGEGKSTVTIGLTQALNKLGKKSVAALREPSLGPVFGVKGGAAGGGYSQVIPMEDINLHFTGDLHAIGVAHNLVAACIDNHLNSGNALGIDINKITWKRVVDMNDRALRSIVIGLGGKANGIPRENSFMITVASEIMAIFCLATSISDMKAMVKRTIFGYDLTGKPLTIGDLHIEGAVAALLKDAIKPNIVQTLENTPVFIHGGPFANIAHGCNSMLATKLALKTSDYAVTEAGFAADLGAEKFFDIKCRKGDLHPNCVVLVATVRALKHHGGAKELGEENIEALKKGCENLDKHLENIKTHYGLPAVVAINRFATDTEAELKYIDEHCKALGTPVALCEVFAKGGEGGVELAKMVMDQIDKNTKDFTPVYPLDMPIKDKITAIATKIYGADKVDFSAKAKKMLKTIEDYGYGNLPVCMAKTQKSLSDNANLIGRPTGWTLTVSELRISAGAGFIVAMCGDIMDMPGLPKKPSAEIIDIDDNGVISGLF